MNLWIKYFFRPLGWVLLAMAVFCWVTVEDPSNAFLAFLAL